MLPTPLISVWSSRARLMVVRRAQGRVEGRVVEGRVQRVAGDVRDGVGQPLGGVLVEREPAEGPLVDEAELGAEGVVEADPDAQMLLVGCVLGLYQELAAHTEVAEERSGPVVQRHPEVLAAAHGRPEAGAAEPGHEIHVAREVAADRTRVQHLDVGDGAAGHPALQTAPYDFDLGQLGHGGAPEGTA
jgi:hypothetical protein